MSIDYSALTKAVQKLADGLDRHNANPNDEQLRDGLIQRFEFTYELSFKLLKRYLASVSANPQEVSDYNFQEVIRLGLRTGMLSAEWADWQLFRQSRTNTSHTYDEEKAREVVETIPLFLAEARHLLDQFKEHAEIDSPSD